VVGSFHAVDLRERCRSPVLLIVPPFAAIERAVLGPHILQACGKEAGYGVDVLYANLHLASIIGEGAYKQISNAPLSFFLGERVFSRAAYGLLPLGHDRGANLVGEAAKMRESAALIGLDPNRVRFDLDWVLNIEATVFEWTETFSAAIANTDARIVGCSTMFDQTSASLALLRRVKELRPDIVTCIGGANCEGEMGAGIKVVGDTLDAVFSGESEKTFVEFLQQRLEKPDNNEAKESDLIFGRPATRMDEIPTPSFVEYESQLKEWLPDSPHAGEDAHWIPYETSRGCWWGERSHCTFCGLNGNGMNFRAKSPDRAIAELRALTAGRRRSLVAMTDNIMPHGYFKNLLPRVESEFPGVYLFYEEKANLTLKNIESLVKAGVKEVQLGIESLSTDLLKLMAKGTNATKNLAVLRYCRIHGLKVQWNMLYGFPNEQLESHEQVLSMIPHIVHLPPPALAVPVVISRFSPYFFKPETFDITNLRPLPGYFDYLPADAPVAEIAYHFQGDYETAETLDSSVNLRLFGAVQQWRRRWLMPQGSPPMLQVNQAGDDYSLTDTRNGRETVYPLTREKASQLLLGSRQFDAESLQWAVERFYVLPIDGALVSLATAEPRIMEDLKAT
tara:strand:+ start:2823 stop:4682 length:1860 start_codon:yes stop_codon:yes gene_type:complete